MKVQCLLFLAAVFAPAAASSEPVIIDRAIKPRVPPDCDPTPLEACALTFFGNFGFEGQFPANESVFDNTLHEYVIIRGVAGWAQVRRWMRELYTCSLGQNNLDLCMQWQMLVVNQNMSKSEAINWEVRYRTLEYNVGAAYNVLTQNWYCINEVDLHEDANIKMCTTIFNNQEHNQPNQTCQHLAQYLVCIQRPYAQNCGSEVGALACHFERIVYEVTHPECADHVAMHCQGAPSAAPSLLNPHETNT